MGKNGILRPMIVGKSQIGKIRILINFSWPVLYPIRGSLSGSTTQSIPYSHRTTTHVIRHKLIS